MHKKHQIKYSQTIKHKGECGAEDELNMCEKRFAEYFKEKYQKKESI